MSTSSTRCSSDAAMPFNSVAKHDIGGVPRRVRLFIASLEWSHAQAIVEGHIGPFMALGEVCVWMFRRCLFFLFGKQPDASEGVGCGDRRFSQEKANRVACQTGREAKALEWRGVLPWHCQGRLAHTHCRRCPLHRANDCTEGSRCFADILPATSSPRHFAIILALGRRTAPEYDIWLVALSPTTLLPRRRFPVDAQA